MTQVLSTAVMASTREASLMFASLSDEQLPRHTNGAPPEPASTKALRKATREEVEAAAAETHTDPSDAQIAAQEVGKAARVPFAHGHAIRKSKTSIIAVNAPHVIKAELAIQKHIHQVFQQVAASVTAQLMSKVGKADDGADQDQEYGPPMPHSILDDILTINLDGLVVLATDDVLPGNLGDVASKAGQSALVQIGVNNRSELVNQTNTNAFNFAKERSAELVGKKWVDGELVDNPDAKWAITDSTRNMLRDAIGASMDEGVGIDGLSQIIQYNFAFSPERATMIARTECLLPNTSVDRAVVRAAFRRWYEGDVIEVITKDGRKLTTTPNHPMLTQRGWVFACMLNDSDYLVCNTRQERFSSAGNSDVDERPPSIAEIFDSIKSVGTVERQTSTCEDFHGDGTEGHVDIVRPFGLLSVGDFAPINKPVLNDFLTEPDKSTATFCDLCGGLLPIHESVHRCSRSKSYSSFQKSVFNDCTANSIKISYGFYTFSSSVFSCKRFYGKVFYTLVGFVSRLFVLVKRRVTPSAVYASSCYDSMCDVRSRSSVSGGFRYVSPTEIAFSDFFSKFWAWSVLNLSSSSNSFSSVSKFNDLAKRASNNPTTDARLFSDVTNAEADDVELDQVVSINKRAFSGHVYNLETPYGYFNIADGAYTGNTIRAHNQGALTGYKAARDDGVNVLKEWLVGEGCCDDCADLGDQDPIPLDDSWDTDDGPIDAPPYHPNCRCSVSPVVGDSDDSDESDDSSDDESDTSDDDTGDE